MRTRTVVDGVLAVVVGGLAVEGSWSAAADRGVRLGFVGFALVVVAAAALVLRRLRPPAALLVSFGATLVYLASGYPYSPILQLVSVAVYSVAAWCRELFSASLVAAAVALYVPLAWWRGGTPWSGFGIVPLAAVWLVAPWVLGVAVRAYRRVRARAAAAERRGYVYEERLRIAREVHDVVGHSLAVINLQAGVALHVAERRPERAVQALRAVREASGRALEDLRATLAVLPSMGEPGLSRVTDLVDAIDLPVTLVVDGEPVALPPAVELAGYRIVQESLTNVVRHAGAVRASVRLRYTSTAVTVTVTDDGRRATVDGPGRGLTGMRERVVALGGTLRAGPLPGGGFEVCAVLPIGGERG